MITNPKPNKIKNLIVAFFLLFNVFNSISQNIAINEVMTSNNTTLADEDGEFEDWIEIYNYGTTAVNLSGYGLSDEGDNAFKWVFPNVTIPAKGFLLIWASDKDKKVANQPLHTNFKLKSGGEPVFLTKTGGTLISEVPAFALASDTSYGRNPDGTGSWKVYTTATPNNSNTGATQADPEKIAINEILTSNTANLADEDGDFPDWIEIYNYGNTSVNLSGFGLSDDSALPYKWVFPSTVLAPNQYILVWASSKDKAVSGQQLHTNFKISSSGENIILTNSSGVLVNGSPSVALETDVSYGRKPDGTGSWLFFDTPTPGASNSGAGATTPLEAPSFSHTSGLYSSTINVSLSTDVQNATIVYTLDGSEPDINNLGGSSFQYKNDYPHEVGLGFGSFLNQNYKSFTYSSPIAISDRSNDADKLAAKNTYVEELYVPPVSVRKSSVLRAKVYLNGKGSRTRTRNYFVWPNGNPYKVPMAALTTFEGNLFEYTNGIYTPGAIFDQWRTENPNGNQPSRAEFSNFGQSGRDWERNVNIQIFNENLESILNQDAGLRIHGNTSRGHHLKNLRLYARSEYDKESKFKVDIFNQQIPNSPNLYNDDFKRLLLRGNGSGGYIANDVVFNRLMQPFFNGIMRIQTSVLFINGEYFGITAFRDRFDEHHIANNFGLDSDNVDIVGCIGGCANEEGDTGAFGELNDLFSYIKNQNLQITSNYEYVKNRLDIDSFIDHVFLEIFSEGDSYETKYWRATNVVDGEFGDGKWRVYTQDFESAMKSALNWLDNFLEESNNPNRGLLINLVKNEEFKNKLLNRFSDLMNTGFNEERFTGLVNATFDEINPLLDEDRNRSPRNRFYASGDQRRLLEWILERPTDFRQQLNTALSLDGTVNLDITLSDNRAGHVKINTIDINPTTPGVSENAYPWSGVYFKDIPVVLEAKEKPGYTFSNWSGSVSGTNKTILVTPTSDMQIRANYTPNEDFSHLIYFWLFGNNIENDTPLETVNATYSRYSLNANINYSSSLTGYPFSSADANWRKASLERKNSPTPINYSPLANNDISYAPQIVKGLQIKQPFKSGGSENTLELNIPTTNFKEIKVSLALTSDGAANTLIVEYWNGTTWLSSGISYTASIAASYAVKEIDFTNVALANNNASFKVRLRFDGLDMFADDGKIVLLNNIAVQGIDETALSTETFETSLQSLKVFPNPTNNEIKIQLNQIIDKVELYNVFGKLVYKTSANSSKTLIDMRSLATGVYLLKVFSNNTAINKKIIKK